MNTSFATDTQLGLWFDPNCSILALAVFLDDSLKSIASSNRFSYSIAQFQAPSNFSSTLSSLSSHDEEK